MRKISNKLLAEYLGRSYGVVDGLWFMKVEERYGFEAALELDRQVWEVLPKIQARMLKRMLNLDGGIEGLRESLEVRLGIDGFEFETGKPARDAFQIIISRCPWHALMVKSGRAHLAGRVGDVVCRADYSAWTREFGEKLGFGLESQICNGAERCIMNFEKTTVV
ncbi:MAG: L-2-amino-thiazoline-4-carboxylic acid hydrolase [Dehalococcoidaceae bacterium]|nr:L-2-amino-thiazoline-4-carboxylic acid hydrolase [Dehalococcoidaceae bacterium]